MTNIVEINKRSLAKRGLDFAILIPTRTGLTKSILDATQTIRSLFELKNFHTYSLQEQGIANRIIEQAFFITPQKVVHTTVSLYRPETKNGDPRLWFPGLKYFAEPEQQIALTFIDKKLCLLNLSRDLFETTPLISNILNRAEIREEKIAKELLAKLSTIASQGPIKAIKKGDTAIGMTIEHSLGIAANSSKQPDYKGIELKSARGAHTTRSTLFAQVADWSQSPNKSSEEILNAHGYIREDDFKLYCTVSAVKSNSQGLRFEIRNGDLLVEVSDIKGDVAVWPINTLKKRLLEKHKETFWIKANATQEEGDEYYELTSVTHTKSPLVNQLVPLLQSGVITMDHLIKRSGKTGRVTEKGPLFKIMPQALPLLFPEPKEYQLK
ncbi:MvaI/BcnI restriction endonuclease family protein [Hafnia paralvei]|uniref:MvaI/BcnI family restriction endonuclease n=1 Tax=Hafnia paralvei TaxID=546367 RepID=UPI001034DCE6|nr:MvaI/BcnI family restriction endonuclease [Hafnia paralvei]TBM01034.1 MvaI/BcnI restriction endonuclease family protein [Hafnia paralvei]